MLVPFSPPPGLNSDDTTFAATGRWADGSNVRFRDGRPQVIAGWRLIKTLSSGSRCNSIFAHTDVAGTVTLYFGTNSKLWKFASDMSGSGTDVTPASPPNGAKWNFASWGSTLLGVPYRGTLYEQSGSGAATGVANAPDRIQDMLVTPQRQVLAFGCNEETSGTFNGLCIRGSDIEDYTDWATTSTNNAFEHILDGPGQIIAARMVGPYVVVWTDTALYIGTFLGDPAQTYRFDLVATNCGAASIDSVIVVNGIAWWITPGLNVMTWAPGATPQMVQCPILKDFQANALSVHDNIDSPVAVFTSHNRRFDEIWFHYIDDRDAASAPTRYIAMSLKDGAWFRGSMRRTAALKHHAPLPSSVTATHEQLFADILDIHSVGSGNAAAGSALNWHIQSADRYLDESQSRAMVRGCIPDFEDQVGDVSLTLFVRDRPQSSATTKGPYTLGTSTTKKDFRASGKLMAVKFSGGAASGSYMRLGKPLFDVVPLGER